MSRFTNRQDEKAPAGAVRAKLAQEIVRNLRLGGGTLPAELIYDPVFENLPPKALFAGICPVKNIPTLYLTGEDAVLRPLTPPGAGAGETIPGAGPGPLHPLDLLRCEEIPDRLIVLCSCI